jgi:hypothetical protein
MTARSSAPLIVPRLTWLSCTAARRPLWFWIGIKVRARAQDHRAGRLGRRFENEVDKQLNVIGRLHRVFVFFHLPTQRLGVKLLPLIDVEKNARAAFVLIQPRPNKLRQVDIAGPEEFGLCMSAANHSIESRAALGGSKAAASWWSGAAYGLRWTIFHTVGSSTHFSRRNPGR